MVDETRFSSGVFVMLKFENKTTKEYFEKAIKRNKYEIEEMEISSEDVI